MLTFPLLWPASAEQRQSWEGQEKAKPSQPHAPIRLFSYKHCEVKEIDIVAPAEHGPSWLLLWRGFFRRAQLFPELSIRLPRLQSLPVGERRSKSRDLKSLTAIMKMAPFFALRDGFLSSRNFSTPAQGRREPFSCLRGVTKICLILSLSRGRRQSYAGPQRHVDNSWRSGCVSLRIFSFGRRSGVKMWAHLTAFPMWHFPRLWWDLKRSPFGIIVEVLTFRFIVNPDEKRWATWTFCVSALRWREEGAGRQAVKEKETEDCGQWECFMHRACRTASFMHCLTFFENF